MFKTKNGDEIHLETDVNGTVALMVRGQTIASYIPETDSWQTIAWVGPSVGMTRSKAGADCPDQPKTWPVSFKVAK